MINKYDKKYKEYLKLQKQLNQLYKDCHKFTNVKLDKPYQKGWIIYYDLREDIKRRADYPLIKQVLDLGYSVNFTNNVKVVKGIRSKNTSLLIKTRRNVVSITDYYPTRTGISEKDYLSDSSFSKYFHLNTTSQQYKRWGYKEYFIDIPSYWLVLKVRANLITHKYVKDGDLEGEYVKLRDRLYYSGEFNPFSTDYSSSYPAYKDRAKVKAQINKFKNGDIDDIFLEKIPLEYDF